MGNLLYCFNNDNDNNDNDNNDNNDNSKLLDKKNIAVDYDYDNNITYIRINLDYLDHHLDDLVIDLPIVDY